MGAPTNKGYLSGNSIVSATGYPLYHLDFLLLILSTFHLGTVSAATCLVIISEEIYKKRLVSQTIAPTAASSSEAITDNNYLLSLPFMPHGGHKT